MSDNPGATSQEAGYSQLLSGSMQRHQMDQNTRCEGNSEGNQIHIRYEIQGNQNTPSGNRQEQGSSSKMGCENESKTSVVSWNRGGAEGNEDNSGYDCYGQRGVNQVANTVDSSIHQHCNTNPTTNEVPINVSFSDSGISEVGSPLRLRLTSSNQSRETGKGYTTRQSHSGRPAPAPELVIPTNVQPNQRPTVHHLPSPLTDVQSRGRVHSQSFYEGRHTNVPQNVPKSFGPGRHLYKAESLEEDLTHLHAFDEEISGVGPLDGHFKRWGGSSSSSKDVDDTDQGWFADDTMVTLRPREKRHLAHIVKFQISKERDRMTKQFEEKYRRYTEAKEMEMLRAHKRFEERVHWYDNRMQQYDHMVQRLLALRGNRNKSDLLPSSDLEEFWQEIGQESRKSDDRALMIPSSTKMRTAELQESYERRLSRLGRLVEELQLQNSTLSQEVEQFQQTLEVADANASSTISSLNNELSEHKDKVSELIRTKKNLEGELHEMQRHSNRMEDAVTSLRDSVRMAEEELVTQVRQLETEWSHKLADAQDRHNQAIQSITSQHAANVAALQTTINDLTQQLKQKNSEIHRLEDQLSEQKQCVQREIDRIRGEVERNSEKIFEDLKEELNKVEKELLRCEKSREKQAEDFDKRIYQLKKEKEVEVKAIQLQLQTQRSALVTTITQEKQTELETLVSALEERYRHVLADVEKSAFQQRQEDLRKINDLQTQISVLKTGAI